MGNQPVICDCQDEPGKPCTASPVSVNIYDLGQKGSTKGLNNLLRKVGTGLFHCSVEVHDIEWGYRGGRSPGSGIFSCLPRKCLGHSFREAIPRGETLLTSEQVSVLIRRLSAGWRMSEYDALRRNCCHFAETLCLSLGVSPLPTWVKSAAEIGEVVEDSLRPLGSRRGVLALASKQEAERYSPPQVITRPKM